jgi:hypothetical protein
MEAHEVLPPQTAQTILATDETAAPVRPVTIPGARDVGNADARVLCGYRDKREQWLAW